MMFALYIGYVTFMKFNERLYNRISRRIQQSKIADETSVEIRNGSNAWKPNTFRAGLLNFLIGKGSLVDKVGFAIVTKISGDVNAVFRKVDMSGDGYIDHDEFKRMIEMLDTKLSEEDISRALEDLDDNRDGKVRDFVHSTIPD
jgi:Ca2+-binding protein (EF-Hand superfamily)